MTYQHILVPVDGSDLSISAFNQALDIAKALGSKITAVSLIADDPFSSVDFYYASPVMKDYFVEAQAQAQATLDKVFNIGAQLGVTVETKLVKGEVSAETIVKTAEELYVDLIIMGSHGRKGFQKFFLGSFAQDVLGQTELPVLVIKK